MKKRLLVVFVFIACICLCLGLYGCTPDIGEEQGDDGHTHTADHYEYDSVQHWKICTVCSEKFAVGNHNFNIVQPFVGTVYVDLLGFDLLR